MEDVMTLVATYQSLMQAEIAKERLEVNGIKAWIADETAYTSGYGAATGGSRVMVADEDLERAGRVLAAEPVNLPDDLDPGAAEPETANPQEQLISEIRALAGTVRNSAALLMIGFFLACFFIASKTRPAHRHSGAAWSDVTAAWENFDYDKAAALTRQFIDRNPRDCSGYARLAYIQLCQGDLTNAAASAEQAYDLFPTEENRDKLAAIRKLLEEKSPAP
jgi:hypothetical protein